MKLLDKIGNFIKDHIMELGIGTIVASVVGSGINSVVNENKRTNAYCEAMKKLPDAIQGGKTTSEEGS